MQNPNWFLNNNTNNQLPNNGARFSAPQQVWPQFQVRTPPNNLQPFANPMANFSPSPFFQYPPPGGFHNLNANNYHVQNPLNLPQFMCNAQTQLQNANQMLQPQIASQGFVPLLHNQFSTGVFPQNLPNMLSNGPANPQFSTGVLQQNLPNMLSNGPANPQDINNGRSYSSSCSHKEFNGGSHKHNDSKRGYWKKQGIRDRNSAKGGRFKSHNRNREKGHKNIQVEEKRPLKISYTAEEIRQWREERRKNFASKANIAKKLDPTQRDGNAAEARRKQIQEILAKQAELGCEVAEVPSHYLTGSRHRNGSGFRKGKFHQNDSSSSRFRKRQRRDDRGGGGGTDDTKIVEALSSSSLLKKLLSSDIKREKNHLLQALRFMVMNSFFDNFPEKPLNFFPTDG